MEILNTLGILGIGGLFGALVTALVSHFLEKERIASERIFSLKSNCYLNLISCFSDEPITLTNSILTKNLVNKEKMEIFYTAMDYVDKLRLKLAEVKLVGSPELVELVDELLKSLLDFSYTQAQIIEALKKGENTPKAIDTDFNKVITLQHGIVKYMRSEIGIDNKI